MSEPCKNSFISTLEFPEEDRSVNNDNRERIEHVITLFEGIRTDACHRLSLREFLMARV